MTAWLIAGALYGAALAGCVTGNAIGNFLVALIRKALS